MPTNNSPPPSKPSNSAPFTPSEALRRIEALETTLQDHFAERNQWNSTVRGWIGKEVVVRLADGYRLTGFLRWIDRYTMCVDVKLDGDTIVHKGAISTIRLSVVGS